jgi:hypothetical protein
LAGAMNRQIADYECMAELIENAEAVEVSQ